MFEPAFELINNGLRSASLPNGIAADFFFIELKEVFIQESRNIHKALSNNPVKVLIYAWSKQHIELLYTGSKVVMQHFFSKQLFPKCRFISSFTKGIHQLSHMLCLYSL